MCVVGEGGGERWWRGGGWVDGQSSLISVAVLENYRHQASWCAIAYVVTPPPKGAAATDHSLLVRTW